MSIFVRAWISPAAPLSPFLSPCSAPFRRLWRKEAKTNYFHDLTKFKFYVKIFQCWIKIFQEAPDVPVTHPMPCLSR
jgi:hypothetical protein